MTHRNPILEKWFGPAGGGALPWEEGRILSFQDFLEEYTLHDSGFLGFFLDPSGAGRALLCFEWDAVWLPDRLKGQMTDPEDWPHLFVRIEGVERFTVADFDPALEGTRTVTDCEVEDSGEGTRLALDDVFGGTTTFLFKGRTTFLALEGSGRILPL